MRIFKVYEHVSDRCICTLFANDYFEAWRQAEENGWFPNNYYIV